MSYKLPKENIAGLVIRQQYDPNVQLRNALTYTGTAFELVLTKGIFWALVSFHWLLYLLKRFHDCTEKFAVQGCTPTGKVFEE